MMYCTPWLSHENICKYIHLPVQSGSTRVLQLMNRTYTREWYLAKVEPHPGDHARLRHQQRYDYGLLHRNGRRPPGHFKPDGVLQIRYELYVLLQRAPRHTGARSYQDDIPEDMKKTTGWPRSCSCKTGLRTKATTTISAKHFTVLIEGDSKSSERDWMGRNTQNKVVVFPKEDRNYKKGDYAQVMITGMHRRNPDR